MLKTCHSQSKAGNPIRLPAFIYFKPLYREGQKVLRYKTKIYSHSITKNILIAFKNTIRMSVDSLIAFGNPIRLSARTLIASTSLSNIARSPTVPSGDTPCLTAGDARRANPWLSDVKPSDTSGVAQHPPPSFQNFIFSLSSCYTLSVTTV